MRDTLSLQVFVRDHRVDAVAQSRFRPHLCSLRAVHLRIELGIEHSAVHIKPPVEVIGSTFHFVRQESVALSTAVVIRRADLVIRDA